MTNWLNRLLRRQPTRELACEEVGELLQHYLDGDVDQERSRLIADHLEECRRCGLEAETYLRIKRTLASQRAHVSDDSIDRLREFGLRLATGDDGSSTSSSW